MLFIDAEGTEYQLFNLLGEGEWQIFGGHGGKRSFGYK